LEVALQQGVPWEVVGRAKQLMEQITDNQGETSPPSQAATSLTPPAFSSSSEDEDQDQDGFPDSSGSTSSSIRKSSSSSSMNEVAWFSVQLNEQHWQTGVELFRSMVGEWQDMKAAAGAEGAGELGGCHELVAYKY
jgi:hypothetical protein